MTFAGACASLTVAASMIWLGGCSPAAARAKSSHADAGQAQSPQEPKTTRPDEPQSPASSNAVGAPKFSTDPCKKDEDCAPAATCHPDRCVATPHAGTMSPDVMCSMECRGGTVDCGFNHCACVASPSGKRFCALVPGPKEKR